MAQVFAPAYLKNILYPGGTGEGGRFAGAECRKVVPEAVNELDGYKGVDYARLVPLLIESIKEQQEQIEQLKQQVKALAGN